MKLVRRLIGVFSVLGLLAWPVFAFLSVMMFDAPGATQSIPTWSLAWSIWTYPFVVLGAWLVRVVARRLGVTEQRLTWLALAPLFSVAWFVASIVALQVVCDGKFAC